MAVVSVKDTGYVGAKIVAPLALFSVSLLGVNSVLVVFLTLVLSCSIAATVYAISQDDGSDSKELPKSESSENKLFNSAVLVTKKLRKFAEENFKEAIRSDDLPEVYKISYQVCEDIRVIVKSWNDVQFSPQLMQLESLYDKDIHDLLSYLESTPASYRDDYYKSLLKVFGFAQKLSSEIVESINDGTISEMKAKFESLDVKYDLDNPYGKD